MNLKGCIVIDGQRGPAYVALGLRAPAWNPAGDALAYSASCNLTKVVIVYDGREGQRFSAIIDGSLTWNPDGSIVGCIAKQNNQPCLVLEGRDGRSWSLRPETGFLMRGDKVIFDDKHSLHDLGFRENGSIFGWTAQL